MIDTGSENSRAVHEVEGWCAESTSESIGLFFFFETINNPWSVVS